ncbi:hypothetical protein VP01_627g3 [Puccinia sorghi]|uniref:Uncharacterized protein n=1 Tax=Puccinia sorghi TaxID=27349 RepID=A0A0L6UIH4_9BASI|nr:hypothetical protein VP01_627g3 [Puccinia sorghi]
MGDNFLAIYILNLDHNRRKPFPENFLGSLMGWKPSPETCLASLMRRKPPQTSAWEFDGEETFPWKLLGQFDGVETFPRTLLRQRQTPGNRVYHCYWHPETLFVNSEAKPKNPQNLKLPEFQFEGVQHGEADSTKLCYTSKLSENYISYQTNFATLSLQTLNTLPHTLTYLLKFFTLLIGVGHGAKANWPSMTFHLPEKLTAKNDNLPPVSQHTICHQTLMADSPLSFPSRVGLVASCHCQAPDTQSLAGYSCQGMLPWYSDLIKPAKFIQNTSSTMGNLLGERRSPECIGWKAVVAIQRANRALTVSQPMGRRRPRLEVGVSTGFNPPPRRMVVLNHIAIIHYHIVSPYYHTCISSHHHMILYHSLASRGCAEQQNRVIRVCRVRICKMWFFLRAIIFKKFQSRLFIDCDYVFKYHDILTI